MKNFNKKNKGFTLIEILVVIGIIAILAAIVIIAINPKKHFDDAKDAQRDANLNTILNAVGQYIVDNKGSLPVSITGSAKEMDEALCKELVPEFVGSMPTDPDSGSEGAGLNDCEDIDAADDYDPSNDNGHDDYGDVAYTIKKTTDNHIQVCTTRSDSDRDGDVDSNDEQLCLTR